jgi:hypothetical protein
MLTPLSFSEMRGVGGLIHFLQLNRISSKPLVFSQIACDHAILSSKRVVFGEIRLCEGLLFEYPISKPNATTTLSSSRDTGFLEPWIRSLASVL